jgi:hypothetical protein
LGAFWLDPQTLAAASGDLKKLEIFDFKTKAWTDLVAVDVRNLIHNWINSPDGKYVYYAAGGKERRFSTFLADRKVETVTSLKDFTRVANFWSAPTPHDRGWLTHVDTRRRHRGNLCTKYALAVMLS